MELKVHVEGVQRVVCGISEQTTCQDVIYALAYATGKTGRFVLIEKWRSSERSLPPNDQPLAVLAKWGEYSKDIVFELRCLDYSTEPEVPVQKSTVPGPPPASNVASNLKPFFIDTMNPAPESGTLRPNSRAAASTASVDPKQSVSLGSASDTESSSSLFQPSLRRQIFSEHFPPQPPRAGSRHRTLSGQSTGPQNSETIYISSNQVKRSIANNDYRASRGPNANLSVLSHSAHERFCNDGFSSSPTPSYASEALNTTYNSSSPNPSIVYDAPTRDARAFARGVSIDSPGVPPMTSSPNPSSQAQYRTAPPSYEYTMAQKRATSNTPLMMLQKQQRSRVSAEHVPPTGQYPRGNRNSMISDSGSSVGVASGSNPSLDRWNSQENLKQLVVKQKSMLNEQEERSFQLDREIESFQKKDQATIREIESMSKMIQQLEAQQKQIRGQIENIDANQTQGELRALKERTAITRASIARTKRDVASKDMEIELQNSIITKLDDEIKQILNEKLSADAEELDIESLKNSIDLVDNENNELEDALVTVERDLKTVEDEIETKKKKLGELNCQIEAEMTEASKMAPTVRKGWV